MTGHYHRDPVVHCNGDCSAMYSGDNLDMQDGATIADLRKILRRHYGWRTAVPARDGGPALDFCPKHKDGAE